jgi:hypothetical protein
VNDRETAEYPEMERVLKSSASVGAWAGGVFGLLVGICWPSVFKDGATLILICSAGVATGAIAGAILGTLMGLGIYDLLKHEQNAPKVDRLYMQRAKRSTMYRRQVALPQGANGFDVRRRQVARSRRTLAQDR